MEDKKLPFIILAGSPDIRDELMEYADVDYKTQIDINGKQMVTRILEAVRDSEYYSYILFTGIPKSEVLIPDGIPEDRVDFYFSEGTKHMDKIVDAAIYLVEKGKKDPSIFPAGTRHCVNLSGDVPGLTGGILRRFIEDCGDREASFNHPVVEKNVMDEGFPNNGRSFIKIEKSYYCTGDINMTDLEYAESLRPILNKLAESRKSFAKSLFIASPWIFLKFILKRIKIKDAEKLLEKVFKLKSKLVISRDAEVAFDVDNPVQLDLIRAHFANIEK